MEQLKILMKESVLVLYQVGTETQLHTDVFKQNYGVILMQRENEDQYFHQFIMQMVQQHHLKRNT